MEAVAAALGFDAYQLEFFLLVSVAVLALRWLACLASCVGAIVCDCADAAHRPLSRSDITRMWGLVMATGGLGAICRIAVDPGETISRIQANTGSLPTGLELSIILAIGPVAYVLSVWGWASLRVSAPGMEWSSKTLATVWHYLTAVGVLVFAALVIGSA